MGLFIAAARGVGLKPTRIITAAEYTSTENIPLVLNTPFTVITTVQKADINNQKYFTEDKLDSLYTPVKIFPHTELRKFNVVIIILESFSKDYIGYYNKKHKYTPFLDSLIRQSLSFDNSFACGKRSIEAIPAILAGIPSLMDNPYITSQYCIDRINSIASLLGPEGYHTSFFHGGTNGTMGFDYFVNIAGIKHYYGKNEYPNPGDFDGNWGIYDEPFFRYFAEQLDNFPQPFFSCLFSLSSHHPYSIPSEYLGKFKGGKLKILKSIEYTDYSLRRFFQTASKKDWFPNTLFVITADHTSQPMTQYYNNKIGAYSVPILFYKPDDIRLRGLSSTIVQHTDIMPSVLDYLGYNKEFICYGNSLFDNTHTHFSVNFNNSVYQIIEGNRVLFFDGDRITGLYRFNTDSFLLKNLIKKERADRQVEKLKAIIQSFGDRLVSNRLTKEGS
jgi:phosphoglycerol transferase MdoB-like AlkP superfamily enzyme